MSTLSSSGSPVSYLSPKERETSSNTSEDDAIMTEVKRSPAILSARERSLLKAARTKNLRGDHRGTDDDTEPDKLELDDDTDDDLEMCKEEHSYRTYDTDDDLFGSDSDDDNGYQPPVPSAGLFPDSDTDDDDDSDYEPPAPYSPPPRASRLRRNVDQTTNYFLGDDSTDDDDDVPFSSAPPPELLTQPPVIALRNHLHHGIGHFGSLTLDDRIALESRNPGTTDNSVTFGCITYDEDGGIYIGYLKNGLPYHYGRLIYSEDVMYQGSWLDGIEHGRGTLTWCDGSKWDGDFWQGQPNGHGYYYPGNGANPMYCELVGAEVQVNSLVKIEEMGEEVEV